MKSIPTLPNPTPATSAIWLPLISVEVFDNPKGESFEQKNLFHILEGIAAAIGIAVFKMNILGKLTSNIAVTMLGIGLTALAIAAPQKE